MCQLIQAGYDPDLILGTSGGAVTSLLSMAGDWDPQGIHRMIRRLRNDYFYRSWWPQGLSFLPSWALGIFRGSVYRHGEALDTFCDSYMSKHLLTQKEFWIGTTDQVRGNSQLFCNLSTDESQLPLDKFDLRTMSVPFPIYLDGQPQEICQAVLGSASIPTFVPPQKIRGRFYTDGGIYYASPLTPLRGCFTQLKKQKGIHFTYINTYDIEEEDVMSSLDFYPGIFRTGAETFANMVRSLLIQDRTTGLCILNPDISRLRKISLRGNATLLRQFFKFRQECRSSFLELYVKSQDHIDLTDFNPDDILNLVDHVQTDYWCRFWWDEEKDFVVKL
jgi:hypothetical protein